MKHFLRISYFATKPFTFYLSVLVVTLLCTAMASTVAMASSRDSRSLPQHDDHGGTPPVVQGTDSDLCTSGVSAGYACDNVELLSRMPLSTIGGGGGADSWGWKDTQTGRYYALQSRSSGTSFIDVTEPREPLYLGNLPSAVSESPWRDVKVYADHAFVVADDIPNHGMQVFDLTRLRGLSTPRQFSADARYTGIGSAHNVAINEGSGYAYIVGAQECAGGLHMVDIRSPKAPAFAGCFSGDGYTHDVQCVTYSGPDVDHLGAEICFGSNEDSVTIIDVSDKNAPVMLGKADYPLMGYSHQGWLDQKQGIFFMGDELDELNFGMNTRTLIFDVQDLDNPVYAGAHKHATSVIDHNLYVSGNYIFQANYQAGMRILRIDHGQSVSLTEVAYFDTSPENDNRDFAGAWNVYPFFAASRRSATWCSSRNCGANRDDAVLTLSCAEVLASEAELYLCGDLDFGPGRLAGGSDSGHRPVGDDRVRQHVAREDPELQATPDGAQLSGGDRGCRSDGGQDSCHSGRDWLFPGDRDARAGTL